MVHDESSLLSQRCPVTEKCLQRGTCLCECSECVKKIAWRVGSQILLLGNGETLLRFPQSTNAPRLLPLALTCLIDCVVLPLSCHCLALSFLKKLSCHCLLHSAHSSPLPMAPKSSQRVGFQRSRDTTPNRPLELPEGSRDELAGTKSTHNQRKRTYHESELEPDQNETEDSSPSTSPAQVKLIRNVFCCNC